jgi:hypothetical protein
LTSINASQLTGPFEFSDTLQADRYVIQNSVDGGATKGIRMWKADNTDWGIYMGSPGAGKSLSGGNAVAGAGFSQHAIRIRTHNSDAQGLIFENSKEELNLSVRGSDGLTYIRGNIGIGTTAPSHKFHVVTHNAVGLFESTGPQAYLRLSTREGHDHRVEIANRPDGRLSLWTANGGDVLNITRAGNVGIGTTSPSAKLEVKGYIKATKFIGDGSGLTSINTSQLTGPFENSEVAFAGAIIASEGNSNSNGFRFKNNAFDGKGDAAWLRYYARSGEACTL